MPLKKLPDFITFLAANTNIGIPPCQQLLRHVKIERANWRVCELKLKIMQAHNICKTQICFFAKNIWIYHRAQLQKHRCIWRQQKIQRLACHISEPCPISYKFLLRHHKMHNNIPDTTTHVVNKAPFEHAHLKQGQKTMNKLQSFFCFVFVTLNLVFPGFVSIWGQ